MITALPTLFVALKQTQRNQISRTFTYPRKKQEARVSLYQLFKLYMIAYVHACMQSRTHLRCNRNSANSLSVFSSEPREFFLSLQRLKTDSLKRIDFKELGNFGLPTQWCEKVAISSCTRRLQTSNFTNIHQIYTK